MHVDALEKEIKLLSDPIKIFEFDFWKRPESNGELEVHIEALTEGSIHAIITCPGIKDALPVYNTKTCRMELVNPDSEKNAANVNTSNSLMKRRQSTRTIQKSRLEKMWLDYWIVKRCKLKTQLERCPCCRSLAQALVEGMKQHKYC